MAVTYSQNGVIVRNTSGGFDTSPNLSTYQLHNDIVQGRIIHTFGNGVFRTCTIDTNSYNLVEISIHFIINGWNVSDNQFHTGQWDDSGTWKWIASSFNDSGTSYSWGFNGTLFDTPSLQVYIGDEIVERHIVDKLNNKAKVVIVRNGRMLYESEHAVTVNNIGSLQFNMLGVRVSAWVEGRVSLGTFIFDGSYIKGNGQIIWGLS